MRDTDYAFCVARLRANERYMLTVKDIDSLCASGSYESALNFLREKKWITSEEKIGECIAYQNKLLWELVSECVPDKNELKVLCTVNDFFNIKAAVKCHFTSSDASEFYVYPTTLNTAALTEHVNSHEFSKIGGVMGECAEKSYKAACLTENGQNADIIIEAAAVSALRVFALKNKNSIIFYLIFIISIFLNRFFPKTICLYAIFYWFYFPMSMTLIKYFYSNSFTYMISSIFGHY